MAKYRHAQLLAVFWELHCFFPVFLDRRKKTKTLELSTANTSGRNARMGGSMGQVLWIQFGATLHSTHHM
jgi:hypothetical protein